MVYWKVADGVVEENITSIIVSEEVNHPLVE